MNADLVMTMLAVLAGMLLSGMLGFVSAERPEPDERR